MKKIISTILAILLLSLPCWGALEFNGSDQDVEVADSAALSGLGAATWSFWFKTTTNFSDYEGFLSKRWFGVAFEWVIGVMSNGKIYVQLDSSAGVGNIYRDRHSTKTDATLADGNWHHVACTTDGTGNINNLHIYIDGILDDGVTATNGTWVSISDTNAKVRIGAQYSAAYFIAATISDARIYKVEMGAAEVATIYSSHGNDNIVGSAGWWRMDEKPAGQTAGAGDVVDLSGNGNTGDGTNTPVYAAEPVTIIKPIQGD